MLAKKTLVYCPVGNHVELGYIAKGERYSFICKECQYVFTWDKAGKLLAPVKLDTRKIQTCDCGSCQTRNERKRLPLLLPWNDEPTSDAD